MIDKVSEVRKEGYRKQLAYEVARRERREQWAISDAEDFCVRKEVEPGTYKPLWWNEKE